jgi:hypothetical protein
MVIPWGGVVALSCQVCATRIAELACVAIPLECGLP